MTAIHGSVTNHGDSTWKTKLVSRSAYRYDCRIDLTCRQFRGRYVGGCWQRMPHTLTWVLDPAARKPPHVHHPILHFFSSVLFTLVLFCICMTENRRARARRSPDGSRQTWPCSRLVAYGLVRGKRTQSYKRGERSLLLDRLASVACLGAKLNLVCKPHWKTRLLCLRTTIGFYLPPEITCARENAHVQSYPSTFCSPARRSARLETISSPSLFLYVFQSRTWWITAKEFMLITCA